MCVNDERIIKTLISHQTALVSFFKNISLMMMRKVSSYLLISHIKCFKLYIPDMILLYYLLVQFLQINHLRELVNDRTTC